MMVDDNIIEFPTKEIKLNDKLMDVIHDYLHANTKDIQIKDSIKQVLIVVDKIKTNLEEYV